jgi:hypothetical protein
VSVGTKFCGSSPFAITNGLIPKDNRPHDPPIPWAGTNGSAPDFYSFNLAGSCTGKSLAVTIQYASVVFASNHTLKVYGNGLPVSCNGNCTVTLPAGSFSTALPIKVEVSSTALTPEVATYTISGKTN